jgi:hypothetical protein
MDRYAAAAGGRHAAPGARGLIRRSRPLAAPEPPDVRPPGTGGQPDVLVQESWPPPAGARPAASGPPSRMALIFSARSAYLASAPCRDGS